MKPKSVYVACGLTHVPNAAFEQYAAVIHSIAANVADLGISVKYALVDSDPQLSCHPEKDRARLCYEWDREMVDSADLVIAESSYPSTGMGIELQLAANRGTPIAFMVNSQFSREAELKLYRNPDGSVHELQIGDGLISLMALGLPNVVGQFVYSNLKQQEETVAEIVRRTLPY